MNDRSTTLIRVTTRKEDGNMSFVHGQADSVVKQRQDALGKHHISLDQCVALRVIDQNVIYHAKSSDKGKGTRSSDDAVIADALVTREKNLFLFLLTADCLPLTLYDPVHEAVGLAHLGRKSSDQLLALELVKYMQQEFDTQPNKLHAYFGPAIHPTSYILDQNRTSFLSDWSSHITKKTPSQLSVDIIGFNEAILVRHGVRSETIFHDNVNTATSPNHFSHYRSYRTGETQGRFATVVGMPYSTLYYQQ